MAIRAGGFASLSVMTLLILVVVAPHCCMARNIIYTGDAIKPEGYLVNGDYQLIMERSLCRLVIFNNATNEVIKYLNEPSTGLNCRATLHNNGSLIITDAHGGNHFQSPASKELGKYALIFDQNGVASIYGPQRWNTTEKTTIGKQYSGAYTINWEERMVNMLRAAN